MLKFLEKKNTPKFLYKNFDGDLDGIAPNRDMVKFVLKNSEDIFLFEKT